MQIPYEVSARRDTGLYNAKLGIWLFLASEVMLFGGLFSSYIFLRLGADPGTWPYGKSFQNIYAGCFNTAVLIVSSITVLKAWEAAKLRNIKGYRIWLGATVACAVVFLVVKSFEYNAKFNHFGAFVRASAFEQYAGELKAMNANVVEHKSSRSYEVTGHLENPGVFDQQKYLKHQIDYAKIKGDSALASRFEQQLSDLKLVIAVDPHMARFGEHGHITDKPLPPGEYALPLSQGEVHAIEAIDPAAEGHGHGEAHAGEQAHGHAQGHGEHQVIEIALKDVWRSGYWFPSYSTYFAIYYTMTGLHALHVIGGALVLSYFALWGHRIYRQNPEHQANRIEVGGLFWHFVDLVWIFLFPILYLL
jgi:cytochrome c oxidase subunit III